MNVRLRDVLPIIQDVPDYPAFLTVDELQASSRRLASSHPGVVQLLTIGQSRQGAPIEALKIGDGPRKALLYAMPHPNEPIGSMTLEYLAQRLSEDDALRRSLGFTWYLVKCVDPDGARLNEGWFKGPFSIERYARHFYRPPGFEQVEWTFPVDYKTLHYHSPLPETRALMTLIEQVRPDFMYSLHNAGFGGVYFYLSHPAPPLYEAFHELVASQGLPLHLGEPEMPYVEAYAPAIYSTVTTAATYEFYLAQTGADPATMIRMGTSSLEYAQTFGDPFYLVCEMPYFYNPAINDTSPSDMVRRDAILQALARSREHLDFLRQQYDAVRDELTASSPFRTAVQESLESSQQYIAAEENWARSDPRTAEMATVAEKFDNLLVRRFYELLTLGMLVRMIEAQVASHGLSPALEKAQQASQRAFAAESAELASELRYSVIPIQKLVRVQLGSALLAADLAAQRR